jgi:hypothetical protein
VVTARELKGKGVGKQRDKHLFFGVRKSPRPKTKPLAKSQPKDKSDLRVRLSREFYEKTRRGIKACKRYGHTSAFAQKNGPLAE